MTKDEFEKEYIERSGMTKEEYDRYNVTLPCHCDYEGCNGWGAISNDPRYIKIHMDLYGSR